MREGLVAANPVIGTNRPAEPIARERVLTDGELVEIWRACGDNDYGRIIRLLIITGQRREEIASLSWPELDLDKMVISLPGDRTKNHRPHDVPLSDQAVAILNEVPRRDGRDFLFGAANGAFSGYSKSKVALDKRILAARAAPARGHQPMPEWRLHDIRRTVATRMADIRIQPHVIEAVLNHVSGHRAGVAGVYNRSLYADEKRDALVRWGNYIEGLVANGQTKVVPIKRA
jgi:integrase